MRPNIHILGIQGSGKGTQSALLVKKYGFAYIASGDVFRRRAQQDDALGQTIQRDLASGKLLADSLIFQIVEDFLQSTPVEHGLLGDGVLRTIAQVEGLKPIWEKYSLDQPLLIHFTLSEEVAMQRLENRHNDQLAHSEATRNDYTPEAIRARFTQYNQLTMPIVTLFSKRNRCISISAAGSIEDIHKAVCTAIESVYSTLYVSDQK